MDVTDNRVLVTGGTRGLGVLVNTAGDGEVSPFEETAAEDWGRTINVNPKGSFFCVGCLWRQWRNGHKRSTELRRGGVPKFNAAVAAGSPPGVWRMSGHPAVQQALRNHTFDSLGLPRLHVSAEA